MDSLTKENFWNDLMEKYPEQMKQLCAWIDEYKKKVDWNWLFNHSQKLDGLDEAGVSSPAPKFHDLPIAMQFGIFVQFTSESNWKYSFVVEAPYPDEFGSYIKMYFDDNRPE